MFENLDRIQWWLVIFLNPFWEKKNFLKVFSLYLVLNHITRAATDHYTDSNQRFLILFFVGLLRVTEIRNASWTDAEIEASMTSGKICFSLKKWADVRGTVRIYFLRAGFRLLMSYRKLCKYNVFLRLCVLFIFPFSSRAKPTKFVFSQYIVSYDLKWEIRIVF